MSYIDLNLKSSFNYLLINVRPENISVHDLSSFTGFNIELLLSLKCLSTHSVPVVCGCIFCERFPSGHGHLQMFSLLQRLTIPYSIQHKVWRFDP